MPKRSADEFGKVVLDKIGQRGIFLASQLVMEYFLSTKSRSEESEWRQRGFVSCRYLDLFYLACGLSDRVYLVCLSS